jgi:hypothetical protein
MSNVALFKAFLYLSTVRVSKLIDTIFPGDIVALLAINNKTYEKPTQQRAAVTKEQIISKGLLRKTGL